MKKNRRLGYNGNIRAGVDSRGRVNLGADLNAREGKINYFISGNLNQRKSNSTNETDRTSFGDFPLTISQQSTSQTKGYFGFARGGLDYFMDNRNTVTISGMYNRGLFKPTDDITTITDSLSPPGITTTSHRINNSERNIKNAGGAISYKHIYPKEGKELTADVNYNQSTVESTGNFQTQNYNPGNIPAGPLSIQLQTINSKTDFITAQTDFDNPISDKLKIETGVRAAIRNYTSATENFLLNDLSNDYEPVPSEITDYK